MNSPLSLHYRQSDDPRRVEVDVRFGDSPARSLWFQSDSLPLRASGDALLCLGLPPAQEVAAPLVLGDPVSRELAAKAPAIRDMLCDWYPGLCRIPLDLPADHAARRETAPRGTGLFFSAGVDSAYSLHSALGTVDTLITLVGADVPVQDTARADRLRHAVRSIAAGHGLQSVIIETNLRQVFDRMIGWVEYHGAALAAVAHMLDDHISRVLVPSSADDASWLRPWGSHPGLDPLWGNDGLAIEHHAMIPRFSKIAAILHDPLLMAHLRVCDYADHNCGHCPDCAFMLDALDVLQGFDRAPTYNRAHHRRGRLVVDGYGTVTDMRDMQRAARSTPRHAALVAEIDRAILRFERLRRLDAITGFDTLLRRFKRLKRRIRYQRAATPAKDQGRSL